MEEKLAELDEIKRLEELTVRCNILVNRRLGFRRDNAIKRSNSTKPLLEEFGMVNDTHEI